MRRQIDLLNKYYEVTVYGNAAKRLLQVNDGKPHPVMLSDEKNGDTVISIGDHVEKIRMACRGEKTFIRAFGRTFTLSVRDPVEQAAEETGGNRNTACAPMPGMITEIHVAVNDPVAKGQPLVTIESMKMLTVINAPRKGKVAKIHLGLGQSFKKNAVLVTLTSEEDE